MADVAMMKTPAEESLGHAFDDLKTKLPGSVSMRSEAFRLFQEKGLPHRRVEEFKYTDLRASLRDAAPFAKPLTSTEAREALNRVPGAFSEVGVARLTFVNGRFVNDLSDVDDLPEGIVVATLPDALRNGDPALGEMGRVKGLSTNPVYALNTAFMSDGVVIRVQKGAAPSKPLHLRFVIDGDVAATATRCLVVLGDGASVVLLETHESIGSAAYQANDTVEIVAGDKASVSHIRLNAHNEATLALSTLGARLGSNVSFSSLNVVVGAKLSRHQIFCAYDGEHSTAHINGATMLRGNQHADTTLQVDHVKPHGVSRELFKTVIDDEATGVFQGKIIVEPHAQKTDGQMMSASLLLSEGGAMNNKPELEIFADDVLCAHGATCGQLDDDLLFYLMARGLPRKEAEALIVQAFLGEAVESVDHDEVRDALFEIIADWLKRRSS